RVRVSGARGRPRPQQLRGLTFAAGGWAGEATFTYCWPDAGEKGRHVSDGLIKLAAGRGIEVAEWHREQFGLGGFWEGSRAVDADAREPLEVTTRLAWRTPDAGSAVAVQRLVALVALSGPPGLQGIGRRRRGASPPAELVDIAPFLIDRAEVEPDVQ